MKDIELIRIASGKNRSALRLAEEAHRGQTRKDSGTPYILHPVHVAVVLAGLGADRNLVCAGCLHDVVEDTDVTLDRIRDEFGDTVARLVDAVTYPKDLRVPLEEKAKVVLDRTSRVGPDAVALKGADLLVNMTDLVRDAEADGAPALHRIFGADRAIRKISHYLELAELLAIELQTTKYERLSEALRDRASELADFHRSLGARQP